MLCVYIFTAERESFEKLVPVTLMASKAIPHVYLT